MNNYSLLLAIPMICSCAVMRGPLSESEARAGKNIGVVSLLGDTFHGVHVGTTAFTNTSYEASVAEWKIDASTEQLIVARLTGLGSVRARSFAHDPGLRKRFIDSWSFFNNGFDYSEMLKLAQQQGFDTLVLVQPTAYDNAKFHKPGYGFFERTFLGSSQRCIYSLFTIEVLSVASGGRVGWEWGFPCSSGETELTWKGSLNEYTPEERALLRGRAEASIKSNVAKAMTELGFR